MDVKVYWNTGFNQVNIPDSPDLLETLSNRTFTSIDIVQDRWIQSINIAASFTSVRDVDYCKVGSMYYYVSAVHMLANDVAQLVLQPDFYTSVGGHNKFNILDGVTERHHTTSDGFGEYTEDDPLLVPSQPLELESKYVNALNDDNPRVFAESTVALYATAFADRAITYVDDDGNKTVTVPDIKYLPQDAKSVSDPTLKPGEVSYDEHYTVSYFQYPDGNDGYHTTQPGTRLYEINATNKKISEGIAKLRSIGAESSIIRQYAVPRDAILVTSGGVAGVNTIVGKSTDYTVELPYEYATVKNRRLFVGRMNAYKLTSMASGNSCEYNPEDIRISAYPTIRMITDVRPTGKPYFRPVSFRGNQSNFFENCVAGQEWANAPLIYTDRSGSTLSAYNFQSEKYVNKVAYEGGMFSVNSGLLTTAISGAAGTAADIASENYGNAAMTAGQSVGSLIKANVEKGVKQDIYNENLRRSYFNYVESQIVAPDVQFPRSDAIRDYLGNGFMLSRTRYSYADLTKLDKVLTMYGYKDTKSLDQNDFTCRKYFNYIKCSDVSVKGNFAMWMADGVAQQLKAGVRIWHVAPDNKYYLDNPIK